MLLRFWSVGLILFCKSIFIQAQIPENYSNQVFINRENSNPSYISLKKKITEKYSHSPSGRWGEFVNGVCEDLKTDKKVIALTFDACGGEKGTGYDKELIDFLRKEKIPATLFVTGRWIDTHFSEFLDLAHDTLFEIENHGLNHRPCSICGESKFGIHGTANAAEAFDEIEGNARKIGALTGIRPVYYRSGTAYIDEACVKLALDLGIITISFQVLSGDASPYVSKKTITNNVLDNIRPGAIVIMHMNHPQWNTCEALRDIVPELRKSGYSFSHMHKYKLTNRSGST